MNQTPAAQRALNHNSECCRIAAVGVLLLLPIALSFRNECVLKLMRQKYFVYLLPRDSFLMQQPFLRFSEEEEREQRNGEKWKLMAYASFKIPGN